MSGPSESIKSRFQRVLIQPMGDLSTKRLVSLDLKIVVWADACLSVSVLLFAFFATYPVFETAQHNAFYSYLILVVIAISFRRSYLLWLGTKAKAVDRLKQWMTSVIISSVTRVLMAGFVLWLAHALILNFPGEDRELLKIIRIAAAVTLILTSGLRMLFVYVVRHHVMNLEANERLLPTQAEKVADLYARLTDDLKLICVYFITWVLIGIAWQWLFIYYTFGEKETGHWPHLCLVGCLSSYVFIVGYGVGIYRKCKARKEVMEEQNN